MPRGIGGGAARSAKLEWFWAGVSLLLTPAVSAPKGHPSDERAFLVSVEVIGRQVIEGSGYPLLSRQSPYCAPHWASGDSKKRFSRRRDGSRHPGGWNYTRLLSNDLAILIVDRQH